MYHLFYGDETANPGSELTFSRFRGLRRFMREQTVFLQSACPGCTSAPILEKRFEEHQVSHSEIVKIAGRDTLAFQDHEGQRLVLTADEKEKTSVKR